VKYSIEKQVSPEGAAGALYNALGSILDEVVVVDPYRVEFRLQRPSGVLPEMLSSLQDGAIVSKKYIEEKGADYADKHPISAGPWQFVEHKPGELMKFKAVEDHYRKTPEFEFLIIKKVPEEATRVAQVRTGEADLAMISHTSIPELLKAGLEVQTVPGAYNNSIVFGGLIISKDDRYDAEYHFLPPLGDIRVREAMDLAIDKQAIIDEMYLGYARPTGIAPVMYPGWEESTLHPYDPERAKELLREAGYPEGFEITMVTYPNPPASEQPLIGLAVAMYWERVGIRTKVTPMTAAAYKTPWREVQNADIVWPQRMGLITFEVINSITFMSNGIMPWFQDPKLDELGERIETEGPSDAEGRIELLKEFAKTVEDLHGTIPLAAVDEVWASGSQIKAWPLEIAGYSKYYEYVRRAE
jgi:peptide/nickel transport system substrate-binding protein